MTGGRRKKGKVEKEVGFKQSQAEAQPMFTLKGKSHLQNASGLWKREVGDKKTGESREKQIKTNLSCGTGGVGINTGTRGTKDLKSEEKRLSSLDEHA